MSRKHLQLMEIQKLELRIAELQKNKNKKKNMEKMYYIIIYIYSIIQWNENSNLSNSP